jgi:hypothetical protein
MKERRVAYRYKLPLHVVIKPLPFANESGALHAMTRDVSTTGVYFTSDQPLAVGNRLDLSLSLPPEVAQGSEVVIDAQARVLRVDTQPTALHNYFGIAAAIDRFNVSRAAVDFALHKAEQSSASGRSTTPR